ncbi:MAG TPA: hypothetical protein VL172_09695 [Kofleriaceae bacterium]|nr:hypothetical protein [Kofleriaceae bacterium]
MRSPRLALSLLLAFGPACVAAVGPSDDTTGDDDPGDPDPGDPPPDDPPPPTAASYVRGSLPPLYQLTPRAEYGRLTEKGVTLADADFVSTAGNFVSAAQKLDELGAQIAAERGLPGLDILARAEDRQRAQQIPFRGNPSDVDLTVVNGVHKAYVPLGGDLMTPGNEVAAVNLDTGSVVRIKTGVRPQRTAVHPAGLIFVCNQYSNYITIIDPRTDQVLRNADGPVEIETEYFCTDLAFVPRNPNAPDVDEQDLYVANGWRGSVLEYKLSVSRDAIGNRPIDVRVIDPVERVPANQPTAEITGAGGNPYRLSVSQDQRALYVANNRGGELARIDLATRTARRVGLNAPTIDVVQVNDIVLVPTTTRDRGLLAADEPNQPLQVLAAPAVFTGLDEQSHVAHPGSMFDGSKSYNFEDVRNGLFTVDAQLNLPTPPVYFTDDVSAEPNYAAAQKVLDGAVPQAVVRNAAGTRAWLALSGSDAVQELEIRSGAFRVADAQGGVLRTAERPFALALDEQAGRIAVATWGGERLQIFDTGGGGLVRDVDLGYATADYPATNMERGEYFFYNADWSNNGRKACAGCHVDELLEDGIGYSNGATAPTEYHQVRPNYNLATTDSYFWNGSFSNGSYASLASDAQTRTNCELVLFGLIEGPASDPAVRVGDPNNRVSNGQDDDCRPDTSGAGVLPDNFARIQQVIAAEKQIKNQLVQQETGLSFDAVTRLADFYSVSELRLPPNPLRYLYDADQLDSATSASIAHGKEVFQASGCGNCHDAGDARHPFTDGLEHGGGSEWRTEFVNTYFNDQRILDALPGGIPQQMVEAISPSVADSEINVHLDPIDYFVPFCFDVTSCLFFEDPLAVRGNLAAESERLDLLVIFNLGNVDRGFVPGNVRGRPAINTPSLRGIWWQSNYLHHGLAHTLNEAVLAPGHPALHDGERGYAVNALGEIDVHGNTSTLTAQDVDDLRLYLYAIE